MADYPTFPASRVPARVRANWDPPTESQAFQVGDLLRRGRTRKECCELLGIHWLQFGDWVYRGAADERAGRDSTYRSFWASANQAALEFKYSVFDRIVEAGKEPRHWQANVWILAKKYPAEFGDKAGQEYSIDGIELEDHLKRVQARESLLTVAAQIDLELVTELDPAIVIAKTKSRQEIHDALEHLDRLIADGEEQFGRLTADVAKNAQNDPGNGTDTQGPYKH